MSYYYLYCKGKQMLLETNKQVIGQKIREFRKLKNLTQFELAEKVGLNEKQISRIEMGLNYPTYTTFVKLIDILDINIENLIKNTSSNISPIENKISYLIKNSNEQELELYYQVLKTLKLGLKNFK